MKENVLVQVNPKLAEALYVILNELGESGRFKDALLQEWYDCLRITGVMGFTNILLVPVVKLEILLESVGDGKIKEAMREI